MASTTLTTEPLSIPVNRIEGLVIPKRGFPLGRVIGRSCSGSSSSSSSFTPSSHFIGRLFLRSLRTASFSIRPRRIGRARSTGATTNSCSATMTFSKRCKTP
jgi:hypothetical protein